jgi:hypothetical protein
VSDHATSLDNPPRKSFSNCVALRSDQCSGKYELHQAFFRDNALTVSTHGHDVVWQGEWYHVFMFAEKAHADLFMSTFAGEPFNPADKGRGKHWMQWKKGLSKPKVKGPYDHTK